LARLPAGLEGGAACGQNPCWTATSSGFRYRDPAASAAGVRKLLLKAKSARRSLLKASGVAMNLSPPLASEVIVQLLARGAAPARGGVRSFTAPQLNQPGRYQATIP
jgi:hypothetical protein